MCTYGPYPTIIFTFSFFNCHFSVQGLVAWYYKETQTVKTSIMYDVIYLYYNTIFVLHSSILCCLCSLQMCPIPNEGNETSPYLIYYPNHIFSTKTSPLLYASLLRLFWSYTVQSFFKQNKDREDSMSKKTEGGERERERMRQKEGSTIIYSKCQFSEFPDVVCC